MHLRLNWATAAASVPQGGLELVTAGDPELVEGVLEVVLHRSGRQAESLGDLAVCQPAGRQRGDLPLATRQRHQPDLLRRRWGADPTARGRQAVGQLVELRGAAAEALAPIGVGGPERRLGGGATR